MTQPSVVQPEPNTQQEVLLEVRDVRMHFPVTSGLPTASWRGKGRR